MKLDKETIEYIVNVVRTAKQIGIEDVIIEPNLVRAIDSLKAVVINQTKNVPNMVFGSIGLTRIDQFLSRYELVRNLEHTVEAITDTGHDGKDLAKSLLMKAKGIKIDYRCANPAAIKAPRQLNDIPKFRVQFVPDTISLIQKAQSSMSATQLSIIYNKSEVTFEFSDVNNDTFKHEFADNVEILDGSAPGIGFAHRYPAKTVIALLKQSSAGHFDIGAKGTFGFISNDIKVYVLPQV